ncbi:hypothetical protein [Desulforamulus aeronauticus]|uniref:Uncharacterized protein n=1 Tax=Desulforamulus aeronauticus DSM 10349 TaxID=1121421 RepID=A0A1M6PNR8_9FIRM|nr:hypothetical protein [Desulforamulus aeronauticus]SHK09583.1 hypothetical protein SAMN02745123_00697 [Desulforamulus aeronauticus DSM 10349]
MTTKISDTDAILTLALVIADMATLIEHDVVHRNIINVTNELVCNASEKPLSNDFFNTLDILVDLLKREKENSFKRIDGY